MATVAWLLAGVLTLAPGMPLLQLCAGVESAMTTSEKDAPGDSGEAIAFLSDVAASHAGSGHLSAHVPCPGHEIAADWIGTAPRVSGVEASAFPRADVLWTAIQTDSDRVDNPVKDNTISRAPPPLAGSGLSLRSVVLLI